MSAPGLNAAEPGDYSDILTLQLLSVKYPLLHFPQRKPLKRPLKYN
jgi:hypothetical protein